VRKILTTEDTKETEMKELNYIIMWKQPDWGLYYRRNEAFAWNLSETQNVGKVLHVEVITLKIFIYLIYTFFLKKHQRKEIYYQIKKAISKKPIKENDKLYTFSLFIMRKKSLENIRKSLQKQLKIINSLFSTKTFSDTVLVVYPPSYIASFAKKNINHDLLISDIVDDVTIRASNQEKIILENEYLKVLPDSDWIITTGASLRRYESLVKKEIEVFPNGVNFTDFCVVEENKKNVKLTIGYVGSINKTLDVDLLEYSIKKLPGVDFLFYGFYDKHGKSSIKRLKTLNNFYYLGELNYKYVPKFIKSCDILINPKKNNYSTQGNDSLKVYQYLSTGKPIVSTSIHPAPIFSKHMLIADTEEAFYKMIEDIINNRVSIKFEKNKIIAQKYDWKEKINYFATKTKLLINRKLTDCS
jgi:hypothetical protein